MPDTYWPLGIAKAQKHQAGLPVSIYKLKKNEQARHSGTLLFPVPSRQRQKDQELETSLRKPYLRREGGREREKTELNIISTLGSTDKGPRCLPSPSLSQALGVNERKELRQQAGGGHS